MLLLDNRKLRVGLWEWGWAALLIQSFMKIYKLIVIM
jgi:hypothetical protein